MPFFCIAAWHVMPTCESVEKCDIHGQECVLHHPQVPIHMQKNKQKHKKKQCLIVLLVDTSATLTPITMVQNVKCMITGLSDSLFVNDDYINV